jgi:hypothetical protein
MTIEAEEPLSLRYRTPPFERAAAMASETPLPPQSWRRGDLLVARRVPGASELKTKPEPIEQWTIVEVDEIPLAIRRVPAKPTASADSILEPVVAGEILPTVSRRDVRRHGVALWTSMNRCYRSSVPSLIDDLVRLMESGDVDSSKLRMLAGRHGVQEDKVGSAANVIRDVVRRERQEHQLG